MIIVIKKNLFIRLFVLICAFLLILSPILSKEPENKLPIIMYHQISNKSPGDYIITPSEFEKDLIYIKSLGYTTILMKDLIDYAQNNSPLPDKPIILTFDDGHESFYATVVPLLEKYDMKAVVSIVGSYVDYFTEIDDHNINYSYLTWDEVEELSKNPHVEVQNHTYNLHSNTGSRLGSKIKKGESLSDYRTLLINDVGKLQEKLKDYTGSYASTFTYPFGYVCKESIDILKELGFSAALTCNEKIVDLDNINLFALGRFNRPHGKSSEAFFKNILN